MFDRALEKGLNSPQTLWVRRRGIVYIYASLLAQVEQTEVVENKSWVLGLCEAVPYMLTRKNRHVSNL